LAEKGFREDIMRKKVYNLEFSPWSPGFEVFGYNFSRVENYEEKIKSLQHLASGHSEFGLKTNTGNHAITAYVEIPENEEKAVLEWADSDSSALTDILLLITLFTGRDVFVVENDFDENGEFVITADHNYFYWGGALRCAIPFEDGPKNDYEFSYDIGLEKGLNETYSMVRSEEWQRKYNKGYFLILAKQAFRRQILESAFIQCWTIWEHLFAVLNQKWLSKKKIISLSSFEKISYILVEYAIREEINNEDREKIKSLADIRNKLIHFGRFPERDSVRNEAELFIRITEFVIAKILGLSPSNLFNTIEKLDNFLCSKKKKG
jgi:hypothetical protein